MTAVEGEPLTANERHGWTADDGTFGARLALVRQRMRWNIKEAARECGVPAASWGTWETGALPRRYTETCQLIADRTGADLVWLIAGSAINRTVSGDLNHCQGELIVPVAKPTRIVRPAAHTVSGTSPLRGITRPPSAMSADRRRPQTVMPRTGPVKRPMAS